MSLKPFITKQRYFTLRYPLAMPLHLKAFILIISLCITACEGGKREKVNEEEAKFTTSDASELFFKNVRAIYYDKTVMNEAALDIYQLKDRPQTDDYPLLHLSIVVNWRYDEAYILTKPNAFLQSIDTLSIMWKDTVRNDRGMYQFSQGSKADHFRLATRLYHSLQARRQLYVLLDDEEIPFMNRRDNREAFRKTMVDYLRLVDLL